MQLALVSSEEAPECQEWEGNHQCGKNQLSHDVSDCWFCCPVEDFMYFGQHFTLNILFSS